MNDDRLVLPAEVRRILGGIHPATLRRWIVEGRFPAPDVNISRRTRAWHASKLRERGLLVDQASPPTPATSPA